MRNQHGKDTRPKKVGADRSARQQLRAEITRTGVTVLALLAGEEGLPEGLSPRLINRWLSGIGPGTSSDHIALVLSRYRALPDAEPGAGRAVPSNRLPLTLDMRDGLEAEFIRTCATVASIVEPAGDVPAGLNARVIRSWLYGEAKSVSPAHWAFVLECLSARPDATGLVFSRPRTSAHDS